MKTANMDLDPEGYPVVAWEHKDEVGINIHGARWNGSTWSSIDPPGAKGGISNTSLDSTWPSVAVSSSGDIYVAWEQNLAEDVIEYYLRVLRAR